MAVKLPMGQYWYSNEVMKTQREKSNAGSTTRGFTGIYMLGGLSIKVDNSWLGYKKQRL